MLHIPGRSEQPQNEELDVAPKPYHRTRFVCNHTLHISTKDGKPTGSWVANETRDGIRYSCGCCGKFYGIQPDKKADVDLYKAYIEQQRRLACPGCGEEPFLG